MLAIVCRLDIGAEARRWLEGLRRVHDPQHAMIEAHFTLVFPFASVAPGEVAAHASSVAGSTDAIGFRLTAAAAVRDATAPRTHVFLLPGEGDSEIRALHARLYSGVLAPELRADIAFRSHVTVAAFDAHDDAVRMADGLGPFDVPGQLTAMDLVAVEKGRVRDLARLPFRSRTSISSLY